MSNTHQMDFKRTPAAHHQPVKTITLANKKWKPLIIIGIFLSILTLASAHFMNNSKQETPELQTVRASTQMKTITISLPSLVNAPKA